MPTGPVQPSWGALWKALYVQDASRTEGDDKGGTQKCPKQLRLSKPTDMTIHWKFFEDHFLMVPFFDPTIFRSNHFQGANAFSEFFSKNLSPKTVKTCIVCGLNYSFHSITGVEFQQITNT
jgi:hypothetical protein